MREDGIAQCGVGEPGNHRNLDGRHDFSGLDPEDAEAKDAVAPGVNESFHEAARLRERLGSQDGEQGKFRHAVGDAALFGLGFAEANPGKLRIGKHTEGHLPSGGHAMAAQDVVPHDAEVVFGDVRDRKSTRLNSSHRL